MPTARSRGSPSRAAGPAGNGEHARVSRITSFYEDFRREFLWMVLHRHRLLQTLVGRDADVRTRD